MSGEALLVFQNGSSEQTIPTNLAKSCWEKECEGVKGSILEMLNDCVAKCAKWGDDCLLAFNMKLAKETLQLHIQRLFFFNGSTQLKGDLLRYFRRFFNTKHTTGFAFLLGKGIWRNIHVWTHDFGIPQFFLSKKIPTKKSPKLLRVSKNPGVGPSLWRNGCRSYRWPNPYLRQCAIAYRSPLRSPRRWRRKTRQSKWSPSSVGWRKLPTNDTRASRREPREPLSDVCVRFASILSKNPTCEHILPERNPTGFWLAFGMIWKKRTKKESDDSLTIF